MEPRKLNGFIFAGESGEMRSLVNTIDVRLLLKPNAFSFLLHASYFIPSGRVYILIAPQLLRGFVAVLFCKLHFLDTKKIV